MKFIKYFKKKGYRKIIKPYIYLYIDKCLINRFLQKHTDTMSMPIFN